MKRWFAVLKHDAHSGRAEKFLTNPVVWNVVCNAWLKLNVRIAAMHTQWATDVPDARLLD
jgi:hypothetical protein